MPDLLVFCPIHRLAAETLDAVMALQWAGGRIDRLFGEDLITPPGGWNILAQYRCAWQVAQQFNYDALLTVESDIVPPGDAALRLWRCLTDGADAAMGLYLYRQQPVATQTPALCLPTRPGEIGSPYTIEALQRSWGKVVETSGGGFGCTMFGRRALEINPQRAGLDCDSWWFMAASAAGLRIVCDTAVICGHVHAGRIIYPALTGVVVMESEPELREGAQVVRVRMLVSVASPCGCPVPGDEIVLPRDVAVSWQAAGYAEILDDISLKPKRRARTHKKVAEASDGLRDS